MAAFSTEWATRQGIGELLAWRVDATGRALTGSGNRGVGAAIIANPYSIGYLGYDCAFCALSVSLCPVRARACVCVRAVNEDVRGTVTDGDCCRVCAQTLSSSICRPPST